jgi:hypothetical protein
VRVGHSDQRRKLNGSYIWWLTSLCT